MNAARKVAIVTGASQGIGKAVAIRLAADGCALVVNYASSAAEADDVVGEISNAGGVAVAIQADVSKQGDVARLFEETARQLGGVDVVVNNAGIMELKPIADAGDELFDRTIAVNVRGTFNMMRAGMKAVRAGGRIINFSSSVLGLALPTYGVYIASKAAVEALTRAAANELRGRSISVNAVAPGPIGTALFLKGKTREDIQNFAKRAPLERLGTPADIAGVISFLAGEEGGWINGQVIRANGGLV
jgi:3-oxoacyl-[acyl-carrier protein] reductase